MAAESAISGGTREQFTEVVESHWTAVYRLLFHLTGRAHDAEEMTQETFLRALKNWTGFQTGTNIRAWLMRIANNLFLDDKRREQRRKVGSLDGDVAGAEIDPAHGLDVDEQSALLRAALAELSETTRLVFHLRAAEDLSFREIAELAGISEEASRWHMHQARVKLLAKMNPYP